METRESRLRELAQRAKGLHFHDREAQSILDEEDWQNYWPLIDASGQITGDITDGQPDEVNIDNEAMIELWRLSPAEQQRIRDDKRDGTFDGYGHLPNAEAVQP